MAFLPGEPVFKPLEKARDDLCTRHRGKHGKRASFLGEKKEGKTRRKKEVGVCKKSGVEVEMP